MEAKRLNQLRIIEDEIGRYLSHAQSSGELTAAPSYGKPLDVDSAWTDTPEELRMGFKILKDAGVAPPEIELFQERARLRQLYASQTSEASKRELNLKLSALEQQISLRLESLRHGL
jgi:Domain of unknown function (DUF1992)